MTSEQPLAIRQFRFPEDYEDVYALWAQAGTGIHLRQSDEPEEIAKKLERDPDLFLVAVVEGRIIGSIMGGFDGRRGMMYHLAVAQAFRQQGIASQLVDELESRLKAKGCLRYYLLVTKDNPQAIRFYENRGWKHMSDLLAYGKALD
jgi:ribosomal protein S18 acetylase RimI-like enzyme